ncbi:MAG: hypothetical protein KBA08_05945 [Firmicutes bacterium]|nr:hypothetical protein [Bacillota bacterium]
MPKKNTNKRGNNRKGSKRGETTRKIIGLLVEKPKLGIRDIAVEIGCSYENVRVIFEKLKKKPESAVLFGYGQGDVLIMLSRRKKHNIIKKESLWRGKANWPASVVATKKSMTNGDMVAACRVHYSYTNGKYRVIDEDMKTIPRSYVYPLSQFF